MIRGLCFHIVTTVVSRVIRNLAAMRVGLLNEGSLHGGKESLMAEKMERLEREPKPMTEPQKEQVRLQNIDLIGELAEMEKQLAEAKEEADRLELEVSDRNVDLGEAKEKNRKQIAHLRACQRHLKNVRMAARNYRKMLNFRQAEKIERLERELKEAKEELAAQDPDEQGGETG